MKRTLSLFVSLLLLATLSGVCFADSAQDRKVGEISIAVFADGEWEKVYKEPRHDHHMDGFYGDGILAFAGMEQFLSLGMGKDITEHRLDESFALKAVIEEPFGGNTSVSLEVYSWDDGKLTRTDDSKLKVETSRKGEWLVEDWTGLEDGKYLIEVKYNITMGEYYRTGSGMFWLLVGEVAESGSRSE